MIEHVIYHSNAMKYESNIIYISIFGWSRMDLISSLVSQSLFTLNATLCSRERKPGIQSAAVRG